MINKINIMIITTTIMMMMMMIIIIIIMIIIIILIIIMILKLQTVGLAGHVMTFYQTFFFIKLEDASNYEHFWT